MFTESPILGCSFNRGFAWGYFLINANCQPWHAGVGVCGLYTGALGSYAYASLSLVALCALCCVARDIRTKASYENVIRFVPVSIHFKALLSVMQTVWQCTLLSLQENCDPQQTAMEVSQPHPLLLIVGTLQNPQECHLGAERTAILRGDMDNAVGLLLASFFVFNLCYPPGLTNFYTVLEVLLLGQTPKKCPITVANVLSQLQYEL